MSEQGSTLFDFLRHGQVATVGLFSAAHEEPLGSIGWKQLDRVTQEQRWDAIVTSPSRRCYDFARYLAQRLDCELTLAEGLDELNFGAWVGLTPDQVWERDPDLLQHWYQQPLRFSAPQGESMDRFVQRVRVDWEALRATYQGGRVLVLTHATVIRVILADVLQIPYAKTLKIYLDYATLTRVLVHADGEMQFLAHGV
ncbi:histidine phosphatase family protein [Thiofilum flexile]|uniref:histidine phosphatase family protein n=1 Tax=Thiofilum flexile TaxID=125627 RepID=UPI000365198E|nr:histidine phosphatase family protein [Thiofilum flexile]